MFVDVLWQLRGLRGVLRSGLETVRSQVERALSVKLRDQGPVDSNNDNALSVGGTNSDGYYR